MFSYLGLLRRAPALVGFGVLACFSSSFGQTFFIATFGADLRAAFGLSNGGFGAVYSTATLLSALSLVWAGRLVDGMGLPRLARFNFLALAAACALLALAPAVPFLLVALYALRLTGQGMATHIAVTTMAKRFTLGRGKAIGLAQLGFPLGEAVLPAFAVLLLGLAGWRAAWGLIAALVALLLVPALHRLAAASPGGAHEAATAAPAPSATLGQVLHEPRFYLLLPGALCSSFVVTGIFFHQSHIVAERGWDPLVFAGLFALYAAGSVASGLVAGALIDRFGAARTVLPAPLALALACALLAFWPTQTGAAAVMLTLGFASGAQSTAFAALWAERYGTAHLGAIRALTHALTVFASALSPLLIGLAFDAGAGVRDTGLSLALGVLAAATLLAAALRGGRDAAGFGGSRVREG
ncbi:MAG: MFS transporter [Geminicoccaceae bacterium]|nr:MFS transporter [Geminicoccaceae bacterium]